MSIPGVGVQTSAAFAAAVDEAGRFKRSRTAGAYFGAVPRRHQSGELDWTGRITKQGDGTVRAPLRGGELDPDAHAADLRAEPGR
jgi:transposase